MCSWSGSNSRARQAGDFWNLPAWPKPCSWNVATSGLGHAQYHLIIVNPYYSISVPDSSDDAKDRIKIIIIFLIVKDFYEIRTINKVFLPNAPYPDG
jgi:hypothetical protein